MTARFHRIASTIVAIAACVAPRSQRARWREEWLAELAHVSAARHDVPGTGRTLVRMALGSIVDAVTLRALAIGARLSPSSLARIGQGVGRDMRLAFRGLTTSPGLTLSIVASLTLGLAASTAGFSVLRTVFLRPFPHVVDQPSLRHVCVVRNDSCFASYDEYLRLRDHIDSAASVSASHPVPLAVKIGETALTMSGALVSANYFDTLGVRPESGRFFTTADETAAWDQPVAVISHGVWQRYFHGSSDAVGGVMLVNGEAVRIVGVAPKQFIGVNPKADGYRTSVWLPFSIGDLALRDNDGHRVSAHAAGPSHRLHIVARMNAGVAPERLEAEAASIAAGFDPGPPPSAQQTGDPTQTELGASAASIHPIFLNDPAQVLPASLAFTGLPTIVLLIACVNAALLLVARATRRSSEWKVRMAIGATRWRLVRQLLIEALVLAFAGGAAGLLVTAGLLRWQERTIPLPVPLDGPVVLFTLSVAVCTALVFGVGPAWTIATRTTIVPGSLGRHRPRNRTRSVLIGVQAMLCVALLATGTQFLRALQTNVGAMGVSDPGRLIIASFDLTPLDYAHADADAFYAELTRQAGRMPGALSVGSSALNYWGASSASDFVRGFLPGDDPTERRWSGASVVAGDLLETLELKLLRGRPLPVDDTSTVRPIVVNEAFERAFPDGVALGRTIRLVPDGSGQEIQAEVVGVIAPPPGDARSDSELRRHLYYTASTTSTRVRHLYIRTSDVAQSIDGLRQLVGQLDNRVPIEATTVEQFFNERRPEERWIAQSMAGLGLFGLMLTTGGLFGVVSYVVALRTPELGIRLALGSSRRNVVTLIVRQAMTPVTIGLVAGTGTAMAGGLLVQSRLYGSEPIDPIALAAGAALLVCATGVASLVPAIRASRIDPNVALRIDT